MKETKGAFGGSSPFKKVKQLFKRKDGKIGSRKAYQGYRKGVAGRKLYKRFRG